MRAGKAGKFGRVPLHVEAVSLLRRYLVETRCPGGLPPAGSEAVKDVIDRSEGV